MKEVYLPHWETRPLASHHVVTTNALLYSNFEPALSPSPPHDHVYRRRCCAEQQHQILIPSVVRAPIMDKLKMIRRDAGVDRLNAALERTHQEELQRMGMPVQHTQNHPHAGEQAPPMMTAGNLNPLLVLAEVAASVARMPSNSAPPQTERPGRSIPTIQLNGSTILQGHDVTAQPSVAHVTHQHVHDHGTGSCAGCKMTNEQMRTVLGCNLPNPLHITVPARINMEMANMGLGSEEESVPVSSGTSTTCPTNNNYLQKNRAVAMHTHTSMRKISPLNSAARARADHYIAHPEHFPVPEYPPFPPVLPPDPERCRMAIRTWLLLKRFLGQGTDDAEAALALMNLNREGIVARLGEPRRGSEELKFLLLGKLYLPGH